MATVAPRTKKRGFARRRYHGSRSIDDMLNVNALYDPESADIHEKAIEAELERDQRADDERTPAQRRADAVTNLFRQSLNRGEVGTSHGAVPHVTYVVHIEPEQGRRMRSSTSCAPTARTAAA